MTLQSKGQTVKFTGGNTIESCNIEYTPNDLLDNSTNQTNLYEVIIHAQNKPGEMSPLHLLRNIIAREKNANRITELTKVLILALKGLNLHVRNQFNQFMDEAISKVDVEGVAALLVAGAKTTAYKKTGITKKQPKSLKELKEKLGVDTTLEVAQNLVDHAKEKQQKADKGKKGQEEAAVESSQFSPPYVGTIPSALKAPEAEKRVPPQVLHQPVPPTRTPPITPPRSPSPSPSPLLSGTQEIPRNISISGASSPQQSNKSITESAPPSPLTSTSTSSSQLPEYIQKQKPEKPDKTVYKKLQQEKMEKEKEEKMEKEKAAAMQSDQSSATTDTNNDIPPPKPARRIPTTAPLKPPRKISGEVK